MLSLIQLHAVTRPSAIEHKPHLYAHLNDSNDADRTQANLAETVPSEYAVAFSSIVFGVFLGQPYCAIFLQMPSPVQYAPC